MLNSSVELKPMVYNCNQNLVESFLLKVPVISDNQILKIQTQQMTDSNGEEVFKEVQNNKENVASCKTVSNAENVTETDATGGC